MSGKDSEKCLKKTNLLVYQQPSGGKHRREPCSSGRKKPAYIPRVHCIPWTDPIRNNAQYVGQSGRNDSTRVTEHMKFIEKSKNTPLLFDEYDMKSSSANHILNSRNSFNPNEDHKIQRICQKAICRPNPKVIRICTGAEMKKMCAPKPCVCPRGRRPSKGLLGLLVFGMKTALAAAAVYVSYDLGIWGSTDDTQELYRMYCRMKNEPNRKNTGKWDPPSCEAERDLFRISPFNPYGQCDDPPFDHERNAYNFQNNWNHAVAYVFAGIAGLPYNIIEKFTKEKPDGDSVKKNVCVPFEDLPENERIINKYK